MTVQWQLRKDRDGRNRSVMASYRFVCLSLLLFCVILFCVSCMGGGDATAPTTNQPTGLNANVAMLTVDMYDSYYGQTDDNLTNPPVWSVLTGADVIVTLINHGQRNHNWAIVKAGVSVPIPYEEGQGGDILLHGIGMVYSNSQTTTTFTAPGPGEYMVICTVSGHYPAMQGLLLVTSPK